MRSYKTPAPAQKFLLDLTSQVTLMFMFAWMNQTVLIFVELLLVESKITIARLWAVSWCDRGGWGLCKGCHKKSAFSP